MSAIRKMQGYVSWEEALGSLRTHQRHSLGLEDRRGPLDTKEQTRGMAWLDGRVWEPGSKFIPGTEHQ